MKDLKDLIQKMHDMYNIESNSEAKITLALVMHSIASKKYPKDYNNYKDILNISHNIDFSAKSYYFMNNIDTYKYDEKTIVITKDDKELKLPIIDVVAFFVKKNPEMTENDLFFIKSFFLEPVNFDKFQISQFLLSIEGF